MAYNFDFDIAAIAVALFTIYHIIHKKGIGQRANYIYMLVVISCLISAVGDIFSVVANAMEANFVVQDFWNYLFLVSHNTMPYLYVMYILHILSISQSFSKKQHLVVAIPLLADYALFVANIFTRCLFYYDFLGMYQHGPLFVVLYGVAIFYASAAFVLVIYHRKLLPRERFFPLILFLVMSAVPVIIQMIHPYLLLELFFQTLGLMGILFAIENKDEVINPSTGLYNRFAFIGRATSVLGSENASVIAVALPDTSYYNSTIGARATDLLLYEVAQWLDGLDKKLTCFDCGNGHFVLCGKDFSADRISALEQTIFERFKQPWGDVGHRTTFPVRVCVMDIPGDVSSVENLLLISDLVFNGKESARLNAASAIETYERRIAVERAIQDALEKNKFQVWYQPIIDRRSGEVNSAEALVRLIDDELGFVSPEEFIPIAEQNGSIIEIGNFVFEEVCNFYQSFYLRDLNVDYIEVNLSPVQCMSEELVARFEEILKKHRLEADRINLEITETAMMENKSQFMKNVSSMIYMGFTFSLDDYGTGYSNISYIFDMPFKIIKIDKSILWRAISPVDGTGSENALITLEHTIQMMKKMGYKTLVEGVETKVQLKALQEMGVDYFQGFYYSKPVPMEPFINYVKEMNV